VLLLAPTWMQVAHLLGADVYWIALVAVCADAIAPLTHHGREKAAAQVAQTVGLAG
jgi:hypothetical protein